MLPSYDSWWIASGLAYRLNRIAVGI